MQYFSWQLNLKRLRKPPIGSPKFWMHTMKKINIVETISKNCSHLSKNKQNKIINLLKKYEKLFNGTLGDINTCPVHLEFKKGAIPKHHKPIPVLKIHEMTLKKELQRLCKLGVLRKCSTY